MPGAGTRGTMRRLASASGGSPSPRAGAGCLGGGGGGARRAAIGRMHFGLGIELRARGIAAVALAPGFMRTERVLEAVADPSALAFTESPEYVGRAVLALAGDPDALRHSGQTFRVGVLAREYGFSALDGRRVPPFRVAWAACAVCGGTGLAGAEDCPACQGLGQVAG